MGKNRHFNLIGSPSSFTSACTGRFSNRADPIVADDGRDPPSRPGLPEPELRPDFLVRTSPRQPISGLAVTCSLLESGKRFGGIDIDQDRVVVHFDFGDQFWGLVTGHPAIYGPAPAPSG